MSQLTVVDPNNNQEENKQYSYNQTLCNNLNHSWNELKDSLYLYSVCDTEQRNHYQVDLISNLAKFYNLIEEVPEFIYDLYMAKIREIENDHWYWQSVMSDNYLQCGLKTLYSKNPTPLHNAQGSVLLSYVLAGQTNLSLYQALPNAIAPHYPISKLVMTEKLTLTAGECAIFTPDSGNITEYQAVTEKCVLFNVFLTNTNFESNSLYIPISPKPIETREVFFAQQLKQSA